MEKFNVRGALGKQSECPFFFATNIKWQNTWCITQNSSRRSLRSDKEVHSISTTDRYTFREQVLRGYSAG